MRTRVESVVRETLGIDAITAKTPVPAGHPSLAVTRLWAALEAEFGTELDLESLMTAADLDALSRQVATAVAVSPSDSETRIDDATTDVGLSAQQQAYLIGTNPALTADAVGCRHYLRLMLPDVDLDALVTAWHAIVARHGALRSTVNSSGVLTVDAVTAEQMLTVVRKTGDPASTMDFGIGVVRESIATAGQAGYRAATVAVVVHQHGGAVVDLAFDMLLLDGYSTERLLSEWGALYSGSSLPAAGTAEFASAVRTLSARTRTSAPPACGEILGELGAATARCVAPPAPTGQRRDSRAGRLSRAEWEAVRAWAAAAGLTASSAVLAAFCATQIHALGGSVVAAVTLSNRPWLPSGSDDMAGPFSYALPVLADDRLDIAELATAVHRQVWRGLENPGLSSVSVARAARRAADDPARGVIDDIGLAFTSMIDAVPAVDADSFARDIQWQAVETSGVALDCEVWEEDGGLRFRWDIADPAAWPVPIVMAMADFENILRMLGAPIVALPVSPTALQESYVVARAADQSAPSGRLAFSFDVPMAVLGQVDATVATWIETYELLSVVLTDDGRFVELAEPPAGWRVPVLRENDRVPETSTGPGIRRDPHAAVRSLLLHRDRPVGVWPAATVAVTVDDAHAQLHVALDISVVDAPWCHFLARELIRMLDGAPARGRLAGPPVDVLDQQGGGRRAVRSPHWEARFAELGELVGGGELPPVSAPSRCRTRIDGEPVELLGLRRAAVAAGSTVDALLLAAFLIACATEHNAPVPVTVVRWGEHPDSTGLTRLSWVATARPDEQVGRLAAELAVLLAEDLAADEVEGLRVRRRLRRAAPAPETPSLVFTCDVDASRWPLPARYRLAAWESATPGVHVDCVGFSDGEVVRFGWDVDQCAFADGWIETAFARYSSMVHRLAVGDDPAPAPRGTPTLPEYRRIVHLFNRTDHEFDAEQPAHRPFERIAAARPDAVAIVTGREEVTYGALNRWAQQIAETLHQAGVRPGDLVVVGCARGAAMVAAVLGTVKAGAAYVPVEPTIPIERFRSVLRQTRATVALVTAETPGPRDVGVRQIDVSPLRHLDLPTHPTRVFPPHHPHRLAYVIFTSGTTGSPKGVAVSHRSLANLLQWCWRIGEFTSDDYGLAVAALGFDLSVFDVFGLLGVGARLYIADDVERRDPAALRGILDRGITFWNSAPAALAQLRTLLDTPLPRLRLIFLSGDYTPLDLPAALRQVSPEARLISLGGATEATVWSNYFAVDRVDPDWRSIPYGRPIDNARYYVLDEHLAPCPIGTEGDLYIAGACVAEGYWGSAAATAGSFVADPHSLRPATRMYRTGDRAYLGADLQLTFTGRADNQVKVRGHRVELAEIEFHIRAHPDVLDVVVLTRPDAGGDTKLVAYVRSAGAPITLPEIRGRCQDVLPDYMLPNHLVCLDTFPVTTNGKLDRAALPWHLPSGTAPNVRDRPVGGLGAATALDQLVAAFEKALGYPIDPDADLWDQGATSFTLVQVSEDIKQRFERPIGVADVLPQPTVRAIAATLTDDPMPAATTGNTVDFFSPASRAAFKAEHRNRRAASAGSPGVALSARPSTGETIRRSVREFAERNVEAAELGELLALLAPESSEFERYRYPSAGDCYGVQTYVLVREGRVNGITPGTYYYRPQTHELEPVGAGLLREAHFYYNRELFDSAAFEIYLIGALDSIEPLYGENAARYLAIEAGAMTQLLQQHQAESGVGLCPIGEVSAAHLSSALGLDSRHVFLCSLLGGATRVRARSEDAVIAHRSEPSALIGLSTMLPGCADNELSELLTSGATGLGPGRPGGVRGRGGWLDSVDRVDIDLLGMTPLEASRTDPQLLLGIERVWSALEDAGYTSEQLRSSAGRVGVFVAAMWQDFGTVTSDICQRISHHFGFDGPSIAIDAGCCSTLTAIHLARRSMADGECAAAVVVGSNLILRSTHLDQLRDWGLVAKDPAADYLPAFAAAAAGWLPGEAVGAMVLRPLADAERAGDNVVAVVAATHAGHHGGGRRFESPSVDGMAASLRTTLDLAGAVPADIGYVECAAAGAAVADAAEMEALGRVLGEHPSRADRSVAPVPIGSVKSVFGHAEAASGMAQIARAVAQIRQGRILPGSTADELNPMVPWDYLPIRVARTIEPLSSARPLTVVQGFAAGGGFAHALLRAPRPRTDSDEGRVGRAEPRAVVWSGATRDQVIASVRQLGEWLASTATVVSLDDLAFSTQRGRSASAWRWGCCVRDIGELQAGIEAVLRSPDSQIAHRGHRSEPRPGGDDADCLALWLDGSLDSWQPARAAGRLVALPKTPLAHPRTPLPAPAGTAPGNTSATGESDVLVHLAAAFAEATGRSPHPGEFDTPLESSSLSSFTLERLAAALTARDIPLRASAFFAHRSLRDAVVDAAAAPSRRVEPAREAGRTRDADPNTDIAVVGMAGRFPGADDLASFWTLLRDGIDAVGAMPPDHAAHDRSAGPLRGGFLTGPELFDSGLFGITPVDADLMDPQERVFLEASWAAMEDAGYPPARLSREYGRAVGVFAATMYSDYSFVGVEERIAGRLVSTGSSTAGIANRVSYAFDFIGPSMTVDTMCSASLTAVHLACRSLRDGECEVALVGGVNVITHPMRFIEQRQLGMTSSSGRCSPFGADADGMVPGEGVGVLVCKSLDRALADGDRIHAVIKGSAIGHTGRTNGYQVPDPTAEAAVMKAALARAGVEPDVVGYIEAHGTGTRIGDPIEVDAVTTVLGTQRPSCPIGSVKSNLGHLEGAAGIAGLIKVILQLRHRYLAPTLHASEPNPLIDWASAAVHVQRQGSPWVLDGTHPRVGCVSSFGAGGATAHVVVAETASPEELPIAPDSVRPQAVVLSARTSSALVKSAERLLRWLDAREAEHLAPSTTDSVDDAAVLRRIARLVDSESSIPDRLVEEIRRALDDRPALRPSTEPPHREAVALLRNLAFTLQIGREPMAERFAVIVSSIAEVRSALRRLIAGAPPIVTADPARTELERACAKWLRGESVDWAGLNSAARGRLLDLPVYPFESRPHRYNPSVRYPGTGWAATLPDRVRGRAPSDDVLLAEIRWIAATEHSARPSSKPRLAFLVAASNRGLPADATAGHELIDLADLPTNHGALQRYMRDLCQRVDAIVDACDFGVDHGVVSQRAARWAVLRATVQLRRRVRWIHVAGVASRGGLGNDLAGLVLALSAESATFHGTALATDERGVDAVRHIEAQVGNSAPQVEYRGGAPYVPVLAAQQPRDGERRALDPNRPYLVTGGTGLLGVLVADHLAARGARRIVLCGTRAVPELSAGDQSAEARRAERVRGAIDRLRVAGVEVELYLGDLADARLAALCEQITDRWGPWAGVVHCAGAMPGVGEFANTDPAELARVFDAKCRLWESRNREQIDRADPDFVILFSSVAATFPALGAGVGSYAAANRYLDQLALRSGQRGVVSIAWPEWEVSGMRGGDTSRCGLAPLRVEDGVAVIDLAIDGLLEPHTVVVTGRARLEPDRLLDLPDITRGLEPRADSVVSAQAPHLGSEVPFAMKQVFAEVLGLADADLDPDTTFHDLGVGSVALAELTVRLEALLGRPVTPTDLIENPTLRRAAEALGAARDIDARRGRRHPGSGRLAVVGMSCRFPAADTVAEFWSNLRSGADSISSVPAGRWDDEAGQPGRGGFVSGVEAFDAEAFGLSADQGISLDPTVRLVLEGVDACLADAGYLRKEVAGSDIGIFVGGRLTDYRHRVIQRHGHAGSGGDQNFMAAMAAHVYDLRGPAMVVDTACSSALGALALARHSLLQGEVSTALVGAAEYLLDRQPYREFAAMGALSGHGECRTFSADADGFVPGEGGAVLMVRRLEDAIADGDRIRAVIDGVAVGNDGWTMGLTTPGLDGQERVIRNAMTMSGRVPAEVGMVEAHGTATVIGDPIELEALSRVFRGGATPRSCAVGSVKSNIGHLLGASGMAGLVKAVLAVQHGVIPPTLHCDNPNPRFNFADSPFFPVTEAMPWPEREGGRVAGVSAFGLGGTNAHAVVSAADPAWSDGRAPLPAPVYRRIRLWVDAVEDRSTASVASLLQFDLHSENGVIPVAGDRPDLDGRVLLPELVDAVSDVAPALDPAALRAENTLSDLGLASIERAEVLVRAMESLDVSVPIARFAKTMSLGEISAVLGGGV
ncbi:amino acid adenylation domain-containing protein [Nocardia sp. NPDC059177]|uniref:amino acid adenylation domain-containing protein n=1 Tax=Nocardia sp. NPDC059177 TaxID=3346759 RepID=UPI00367D04FA